MSEKEKNKISKKWISMAKDIVKRALIAPPKATGIHVDESGPLMKQGGEHSFSDRIYLNVGGAYTAGLISGGFVGIVRSLRNPPVPLANASWRLRLNTILNGMESSSGRWANSWGLIALGYTSIEEVLSHIITPNLKSSDERRDQDSFLSPIARGCLAGGLCGGLFRAHAGLSSTVVGTVFGGVIGGAHARVSHSNS